MALSKLLLHVGAICISVGTKYSKSEQLFADSQYDFISV